jgi:hypothetical protein
LARPITIKLGREGHNIGAIKTTDKVLDSVIQTYYVEYKIENELSSPYQDTNQFKLNNTEANLKSQLVDTAFIFSPHHVAAYLASRHQLQLLL